MFVFSKSRALHASRLVVQLLTDVGLSLEWKDVIMPLVAEISEKVEDQHMTLPNIYTNDALLLLLLGQK